MRGLQAAVLIAVLPALAGAGMPVEPAPLDVRYEMQARGLTIAEVHWKLVRLSSGFVLESRSEVAGLAALLGEDSIVERSEWSDGPHARPVHYSYRRSGRRERSVTVDFNWATGTARATTGSDTVSYPISPGTVDGLGYVLAVMRDLAAGARRLGYDVAAARGVRRYAFEVRGREQLDTALGPVETLRVDRLRDGGKRKTTLWLAQPAAQTDTVQTGKHHVQHDGVVFVDGAQMQTGDSVRCKVHRVPPQFQEFTHVGREPRLVLDQEDAHRGAACDASFTSPRPGRRAARITGTPAR